MGVVHIISSFLRDYGIDRSILHIIPTKNLMCDVVKIIKVSASFGSSFNKQ